MRRETKIQVLVVGAGPVGMITALVLARAGIKVRVIDKAAGDTTRSYACILHARTMRVLEALELADEINRLAGSISVVRCFNGATEFADLDLENAGGALTILPQSDLENLLERRLARLGVTVEWAHRLSSATLSDDHMIAVVDELGSSGSGYAVPHFDQVIKRTDEIRAKFIVGADGRDSRVRELLQLKENPAAPIAFYHMYEIQSRGAAPDDVRIIVDSTTTNSYTPLSENRGRWIFQIAPEELPEDAHLKDRGHFRIIDPRAGELGFLQQLIELRAPWFDALVDEVEWHGTISFQPAIVERFGHGRVWLAGDAAHIAGPIGMQSMNLGLCEGVELGHILSGLLSGNASFESLANYDPNFRLEWKRLLNPADLSSKTIGADRNGVIAERLLPCLPATGDDLHRLFAQLGIRYQAASLQNDFTSAEIMAAEV